VYIYLLMRTRSSSLSQCCRPRNADGFARGFRDKHSMYYSNVVCLRKKRICTRWTIILHERRQRRRKPSSTKKQYNRKMLWSGGRI